MSDPLGIGVRPETPRRVEVVTVIKVVGCRGYGVAVDTFREVTQFWSFDGKLLAEDDPFPDAAPEVP